jgi:Na+/melibiose symporter-like transporter
MKILVLPALLLILVACDYREYPQEEEWKEDFKKQLEEREN